MRSLRRFQRLLASYGAAFWFCYAANIAQMIAVSVLFRYADFVRALGGDDVLLGWITGVGMTGSLIVRIAQGAAIDRVGPRTVWVLSLAAFILAQAGHCWLTTVHGPQVYLLRTLMMVGIAGAFGASLTHVSLLAPPGRMGEYIGVLGSSGFIGLALGPWLGDLLLADVPATPQAMLRMFVWAGAAGLAALLLAVQAGRAAPVKRRVAWETRRRRRSIGVFVLIRRYHPGPLLIIGAAMGLGLGLPGVFVRPFARELHIDRVKLFFLAYAATAFSVRIIARQWTDLWGVRPMVLAGGSLLSLSMVVFCMVQGPWTLALPAISTGVAHALLFPAVVTGAGQSFAARNRGLATNLIMGMFDLGGLLGQPLAATVLWAAGTAGWPRYTSMFLVMACLLACATCCYAAATRKKGSGRSA